MVAGRRLWGHNEERTAEHQPGCGGDLGVEAVVQDRLRSREEGGLGAGVQPCRQVDQEDDGKAEQAERKDDPPQPPTTPVAQYRQGQGGGQQRDGDQQVGVGLAGGLGIDRGRGRRRQTGIARLADLDRAVIDELRDREAGGRGEDRQADRSLGSENGTGARRHPLCQHTNAQQRSFDHSQTAEEKYAGGPQSPADGPAPAPPACLDPVAQSGDRWPGALEQLVCPAVDVARPPGRPLGCRAEALDPLDGHRAYAPPRRCYHRASLRLLFCSSFRRAREGLFHAPIPAIFAGRLRFL